MQKQKVTKKKTEKKPNSTSMNKKAKGSSLIRLFPDHDCRIPSSTNSNFLLNYYLNHRLPCSRHDVETVKKKPMFDFGGSFGGPQLKSDNKIGPVKLTFDANFGRTEESLFTEPTVTRGFEIGASYKIFGIGVKVEQKGEGRTKPYDFDQNGDVIVGSNRTENDILAKSPWKWQVRLFKKTFGNMNVEYSEEDFSYKFDEAFIFWGLKGEMNMSEIMRRMNDNLKQFRIYNDPKYKNSTMRCHY